MNVSRKDWLNYVRQLKAVSDQAGALMESYIAKYGFSNMQALINYAFALTQAYGEAAAAMSAEMYDAVAQASKKYLPPAEPADTPDYGEIAKTMNGIHKTSENPSEYGGAVGRMVKRTGADTTLNNALRDGAEFAWIPNGDTCPFCTMLASRGWQKMSKKALKNGHAEHIHSNCDCTYAIQFDGQPEYENYDPDKYLEQYYGAEGDTPRERLNYMRRQQYAANPEKYRAQKRAVYAIKRHHSLYTYDDPIREKIGSAETSDPEQLAAIIKELRDNGVIIIRREHGMAYQPSPTPGKPGQIIMEKGASISAWMHERQHFLDDKAIGWTGYRAFTAPEKAAIFEQKAYDVEIDYANKLGYTDVVERLKMLKKHSIESILKND